MISAKKIIEHSNIVNAKNLRCGIIFPVSIVSKIFSINRPEIIGKPFALTINGIGNNDPNSKLSQII